MSINRRDAEGAEKLLIYLCVLCASAVQFVFAEDLQQAAFAARIGRLTAGRDISSLVLHLDTGQPLASYKADSFYSRSVSLGSLIKPITALAYLRQEGLQASPVFFCPKTPPGSEDLPDCWFHPGHGRIDVARAIAVSCNHYFFELSNRIRWHSFLETLAEFQIVDEPDLMLLREISTPEQRAEILVGRNARLSVRPVRMAYALAALFNGGKLFSASADGSGDVFVRRLALEDWHADQVRSGMQESARRGTGRRAGLVRSATYTKTGTSGRTDQTAAALNTEAWCIAVAPEIHPPLVVLARVRPGRGASDAAPLAGESLRAYLQLLSASR